MPNLTTTQKIVILFSAFIVILIIDKFPPQFFDIFGIGVFSYLIFLSNKMLDSASSDLKESAFIVYLIGILGLIIDSYFVLTKYFT